MSAGEILPDQPPQSAGPGPVAALRSRANHSTKSNQPPTTDRFAFAITLWLIAQLGALGLAAMRPMLWSRSAMDSERYALAMMLVVQIGLSSLMFPVLLRKFSSVVIVFATAWPMAQLACVLADAPVIGCIRGELYLLAWIIVLHLWCGILTTRFRGSIASCIGGLLAFGGPILWYLRAEFAVESIQVDWSLAGRFGPMMGALSQVVPAGPVMGAWELIAVGILGRIVVSLIELCKDRQSKKPRI